MEKELSTKTDTDEYLSFTDGKIELPIDIQKRMLKFFMQTSILRKKINNTVNPLSDDGKTGDENENRDLL